LALGTDAENRDEADLSASYLLEARNAALASGDPHLLVWVDVWLGWAEMYTESARAGDLSATRAHFDEALTVAESTGNPTLLAYAQSKVGILADEEGDYATGLAYHLETQKSFERSGELAGVGYAMSRASFSSYWLGDYEGALSYAREALRAFSEINHTWGVISSLCRVGYAAVGTGEPGEAQDAFADALRQAREAGMRALVAHAACGLGVIRARTGDLDQAVSILTATTHVDGLPPLYRRIAEVELDDLARRMPAVEFESARGTADAGLDAIADELLQEIEKPKHADDVEAALARQASLK
jgi:tetratricopeptide (TPR) repeat protein